jgi:hypothetical protein
MHWGQMFHHDRNSNERLIRAAAERKALVCGDCCLGSCGRKKLQLVRPPHAVAPLSDKELLLKEALCFRSHQTQEEQIVRYQYCQLMSTSQVDVFIGPHSPYL